MSLPDEFNCLWREKCPLAGICRHVVSEDVTLFYTTTTRVGKECPYFVEDKSEPEGEGN